MTLTLLAAGALLAGCSGEAEPADPPTGEDALTSETAPTTDAAPTTEAPPDDVVETSSPPDVVETTEAAGPPELPEEATEDSEAGAAAFAEHYIAVINYTSKHPEVGLLESLSKDTCDTCHNFESTVTESVATGEVSRNDIFEITDTVSLYRVADSEANVRVSTKQVEQDIFDPSGEVVDHLDEATGTLAFAMSFDETWIIDDLRIEVQ